MENLKYTGKYFSDRLPDWKRKKDTFVSRIITRPLSFYGASFCANRGISANTVSYVSGWVAIIACALYLPSNYYLHLIGGFLFNFWIFMDCIDGNLARSVKKQPFGIFADAISSYLLIGFMATCLGFACYHEGGFLFKAGNPWIILIGALASSSDTMMRLIYHKYEQARLELVSKGIIPAENDDHNDHSKVSDWKIRAEHELGADGILPLFVLLCTLFHALDIAVIYCFCYYGGAFAVSYFIYVRKAISLCKKYEDKMPQNNENML